MNEDETRFIELFRLIIPGFDSVTDDMVMAMRKVCLPQVSFERFGKLYDEALCYLIAHRLTIQEVISTQGATSASLTAGAVVSEKEGDLARSFGASGSSNNGAATDTLDKTVYGQEFKRIRNMCVLSVATRFG